MKKFVSLVTVMACAFTMTTAVIAQDEAEVGAQDEIVQEQEDEIDEDEVDETDVISDIEAISADITDEVSVFVDGEAILFDVAPMIDPETNRTLVPLRAVFEYLGAEIEWDDETKTATAIKGDTVVVITIDDVNATINGEVVVLDQPAVIVESRTLAPLRFVAEAFGGDVDWDSATKTASITMPEGEATEVEEAIDDEDHEDEDDEDNEDEEDEDDEDEE